MGSTPVIIEVTLNAPAERVWQAITEKDKMKQWYFEVPEFKPEVGFKFKYGTTSLVLYSNNSWKREKSIKNHKARLNIITCDY
jgi:uncharacterized protein YndB with AHSA1/START domain